MFPRLVGWFLGKGIYEVSIASAVFITALKIMALQVGIDGYPLDTALVGFILVLFGLLGQSAKATVDAQQAALQMSIMTVADTTRAVVRLMDIPSIQSSHIKDMSRSLTLFLSGVISQIVRDTPSLNLYGVDQVSKKLPMDPASKADLINLINKLDRERSAITFGLQQRLPRHEKCGLLTMAGLLVVSSMVDYNPDAPVSGAMFSGLIVFFVVFVVMSIFDADDAPGRVVGDINLDWTPLDNVYDELTNPRRTSV